MGRYFKHTQTMKLIAFTSEKERYRYPESTKGPSAEAWKGFLTLVSNCPPVPESRSIYR
jgi:hypothetical protein